MDSEYYSELLSDLEYEKELLLEQLDIERERVRELEAELRALLAERQSESAP